MMAGVRHAATLDCWDHSLEQLLPSALRGKDSSEEIAQSEAERVVLVLGLDVVELGILAHEETVVERHAEVIGDAIADSGAELPGAHRIALVGERSEEQTSELQTRMRNSYAVFCLKKKNNTAIIT